MLTTALLTTLALSSPDVQTIREIAMLQGEWELISVDGKRPERELRLTIKGSEIIDDYFSKMGSTFTVETTTFPKEIHLKAYSRWRRWYVVPIPYEVTRTHLRIGSTLLFSRVPIGRRQ